jgi:hypothetical protein
MPMGSGFPRRLCTSAELELGRCLRLPREGPCECELYHQGNGLDNKLFFWHANQVVKTNGSRDAMQRLLELFDQQASTRAALATTQR